MVWATAYLSGCLRGRYVRTTGNTVSIEVESELGSLFSKFLITTREPLRVVMARGRSPGAHLGSHCKHVIHTEKRTPRANSVAGHGGAATWETDRRLTSSRLVWTPE